MAATKAGRSCSFPVIAVECGLSLRVLRRNSGLPSMIPRLGGRGLRQTVLRVPVGRCTRPPGIFLRLSFLIAARRAPVRPHPIFWTLRDVASAPRSSGQVSRITQIWPEVVFDHEGVLFRRANRTDPPSSDALCTLELLSKDREQEVPKETVVFRDSLHQSGRLAEWLKKAAERRGN